MTSPSPAKLPTTGWRADIEFEHIQYLIKVGLLIGVLAGGLFFADSLRKKSGAGWFDFFAGFSKFGKHVVMLVPKATQGFNLVSAVALSVGGFMIWLTIELLTPDEAPLKGPLDQAPPAANTPQTISSSDSFSIDEIVPTDPKQKMPPANTLENSEHIGNPDVESMEP